MFNNTNSVDIDLTIDDKTITHTAKRRRIDIDLSTEFEMDTPVVNMLPEITNFNGDNERKMDIDEPVVMTDDARAIIDRRTQESIEFLSEYTRSIGRTSKKQPQKSPDNIGEINSNGHLKQKYCINLDGKVFGLSEMLSMKRNKLRTILKLNSGTRVELLLTILSQVNANKLLMFRTILLETKVQLRVRLRKTGFEPVGTILALLTSAIG